MIASYFNIFVNQIQKQQNRLYNKYLVQAKEGAASSKTIKASSDCERTNFTKKILNIVLAVDIFPKTIPTFQPRSFEYRSNTLFSHKHRRNRNLNIPIGNTYLKFKFQPV